MFSTLIMRSLPIHLRKEGLQFSFRHRHIHQTTGKLQSCCLPCVQDADFNDEITVDRRYSKVTEVNIRYPAHVLQNFRSCLWINLVEEILATVDTLIPGESVIKAKGSRAEVSSISGPVVEMGLEGHRDH